MPWASQAVPTLQRLWLSLPCNARQVSARIEGFVLKWSPERRTPCLSAAARRPTCPLLTPDKAGSLWEPGPAPCEGRGSLSITLPCPPLSPHAGVGEEAWSQRQWFVCEDRIIGRAGAGRVLAGGRVLLEGHGEIQVLWGEMAPSAPVLSVPTLPTLLPMTPPATHLLRNGCQDLVQPLHELLEGGALRGHGVPALPHQHVPAV